VAEELDDAGTPPRGDVVVELDHAAAFDRRQTRPPGPPADRVGVLVAAPGVGQDDQVGIGVDDELRRQLRVVAGAAGRLVGDVLQAELGEQRVGSTLGW
jgi:hypothetical protein